MKRQLFTFLAVLGLFLTLTGCKRQDTSARGAVYTAQSYTTKGQTKPVTTAVEMTLYLNRDDDQGVLSTATLTTNPYYRRYETLTRHSQGSQTTLKTTGEIVAANFATKSDAEAGINPTKYSYNQNGDTRSAGTFTKTKTGLDLKLGKTVWHFKQTEKQTRYQLPYGIAQQAKQAKVDQN
ncbi:hypothetical protein ACFQ5J_09455 [Lacticaseibacillus baoqingensis]|uniref:Lipoprotein n=1 Tax=Lacticaseibacillus baoqingensis TaxID=2486013 RepID=A0ABW4EA42_9LACO|nr:hypothetical protein [Lacticaseibacillus baoqingensis]